MKNKCADTVANILVEHIILRFGMLMVIHSDQGREFENGLMKSLCTLLGCTNTRTAPYHPESDGCPTVLDILLWKGARWPTSYRTA